MAGTPEDTDAKIRLIFDDQARAAMAASEKHVIGWKDRVGAGLDKINVAGGKAIGVIGALGAAIATTAIVKTVEWTRAAAAHADAILDLNRTTALSIAEIQELEYAEAALQVQTGTLTGAHEMLGKKIYEAAVEKSKATIEAFRRVGVTMDDLVGPDGTLASAGPVFDKAAQGLLEISSTSEKAGVASDLFGRQLGGETLRAILDASGGLEALKREAHEFNAVISDESVIALADFAAEQGKTERALQGLRNIVAVETVDDLRQFNTAVQDFAKENGEAVRDIAKWTSSGVRTVTGFMGSMIGAWIELSGNLAQIPEVAERAWIGLVTTVMDKAVDFRDTLSDTVGPNGMKVLRHMPMINGMVQLGDAADAAGEKYWALRARGAELDNQIGNTTAELKKQAQAYYDLGGAIAADPAAPGARKASPSGTPAGPSPGAGGLSEDEEAADRRTGDRLQRILDARMEAETKILDNARQLGMSQVEIARENMTLELDEWSANYQVREALEKLHGEKILALKRQSAANQYSVQGQMLGAIAAAAQAFGVKNVILQKGLAVSQAVIDGHLAVQKALAAYPPPLNFKAAAAVRIATLANVVGILAVSPGGSAGGGGGGEGEGSFSPSGGEAGEPGSFGRPEPVASSAPAQPSRMLQVQIINPIGDYAWVRDSLMPTIGEVWKDGTRFEIDQTPTQG